MLAQHAHGPRLTPESSKINRRKEGEKRGSEGKGRKERKERNGGEKKEEG